MPCTLATAKSIYLDPVTYEVAMFQNLFTTIARGDKGAAAFYRHD